MRRETNILYNSLASMASPDSALLKSWPFQDSSPRRKTGSLAVALLLLVSSISASRGADLSDLTWTTLGGEVAITGCSTSATGSLDIPEYIEGNPVTSIGAQAFYGCAGLIEVTIPSSVISIGTRPFGFCSQLANITVEAGNLNYESREGVLFNSSLTQLIQHPARKNSFHYTVPDSVNSVEDGAFSLCQSLRGVTLPDSVTSIGNEAFSECINLTSAAIPGFVTSIGSSAFFGCDSLTDATIPGSVTTIGDSSFFECESLTDITIPGSVNFIGDNAFSGCRNLTDITVEASNTSYSSQDGILLNAALTRLIHYPARKSGVNYAIPSSVTSIAEGAFYWCRLASVTIPSSVTSIGDLAFFECNNLTGMTIPNSVTSIGNQAFYQCSRLASMTIPDSVTSIGNEAFYQCYNLTDITILGPVTSIGDRTFSWCASLTDVVLPSTLISIGSEAFHECYILTAITIPDSVTSVGDQAFKGCSDLTDLTLPSSLNSIGNQAFKQCSSLTGVSLPSMVTAIGNEAFSQCSSLANANIPGSVSSIGDEAFAYCSSLTSVSIPGSVTSVGTMTFSQCFSLVNVSIPMSVTSIRDGAFNGCTSLTSLTIPDSVTSIGEQAFVGCTSLTDVTIPNSVASVGHMVFYGCTSMTGITVEGGNANYASQDGILFNASRTRLIQYPVAKIDTYYSIPESGTSIGSGAFGLCPSLTGVTIPDSVTSIGGAAFNGCSSLTGVTIPDSVTAIGGAAFYGCTSLTVVTIPNSVTSIETNSFAQCTSLTSVTIPESVNSIRSSAFQGSGLRNITILDRVTSIESGAFTGNVFLESVYFLGGAPQVHRSAFTNYVSRLTATAFVLPEHAASFGGDGDRWRGLWVEVMDGRAATSLRPDASSVYFLTSEPPTFRLYVPGVSGITITQAEVRLNGEASATSSNPAIQSDTYGDYIEITWPLTGSAVRRGAFEVEVVITDTTGASSVSDSFTAYLEPRHLVDVVPVDGFVVGIEEIREAVTFVIANMRDDAVAWDRENLLNPVEYVDELFSTGLRDYRKLAGGAIYQLSYITDLERSRVVRILNEKFPGSIRVSGRESSLHTPASANFEPGSAWQDWTASHLTAGVTGTSGGGGLTRVRIYVVDNGGNLYHPEFAGTQLWVDPEAAPPNGGTYWSPIFDNDPISPSPIASTQFYLNNQPGVLPENWDRRHGTATCAAIAGSTLGIRGRATELGFGDVPFTMIPVNAYLDAAAGPADAIETTTDALAVSGAVWDIIEDVRRNPGPAVLALPLVTEYNQPNRTLECAVLAAVDAGIFVVAAAGNEGRPVGDYPEYLDVHCLDDSEGLGLRVFDVEDIAQLPIDGQAEIFLGRIGPAKTLHVRAFGAAGEQLADLPEAALRHPEPLIQNVPIDEINSRLEELEEVIILQSQVLAGAAQAASLAANEVSGYRLDSFFGSTLPNQQFSTVLVARTGFGDGDYTVRIFDEAGLYQDTVLSAGEDAELIAQIESLGSQSAAETYRLENQLVQSVVRAANDIAISNLQRGSRFPTGQGYSPARIPHIVTAGAGDPAAVGGVWSQSNAGDIDLYAPGAALRVAVAGDEDYAGGSGTSFATAYIAGAAALLLCEHPDLSPAEVTAILTETESAQGLPIEDEPSLRLWSRGSPGLPTYVSWLRRRGLTEAAYPESGDNDGDGITNRTEFHANLDPSTANAPSDLVSFRRTTGSVGEFTFRRAPWAPDETLCVTSSGSLLDWQSIPESDEEVLPGRESTAVLRKVNAALDPSAASKFYRFEEQ